MNRDQDKKPSVSLIITDIDNTLFDWFDVWYRSFRSQLDVLVQLSGISEAVLLREFKTVHQRYGTAEYAYSLDELPCLADGVTGEPASKRYSAALVAFTEARNAALKLYPGVLDTLREVRSHGTLCVGYTDTMPLYTTYRLGVLGLDGLLDYVYSPENHAISATMSPADLLRFPVVSTPLRKTEVRHTPPGERKPNPDVLAVIVEEVGGKRDETIYVGDSKMNDIAMAQQAGIIDVYAKYGSTSGDPRYSLLVDVTFWPDNKVANEKTAEPAPPRYTLDRSFAQLLDFFSFASLKR